MTAYWVEWLSLLGRWLHFVVGIAWVGASFYFVWLDNHVISPSDPDEKKKGVGGELWSVHGGSFYHARKFRVAPEKMPETLHWFKWEAYSTWLSGMFLLVLIYWYGAEIYLIDTQLMNLAPLSAVAIGATTIIGGWIIYDLLCRSVLSRDDRLLGAVVALLTFLVAYGLCQVFSGRGAYIHFGAMLGTIMVANVFFIIIPGQRAMVASAARGETPDPVPGIKARQRSVHNTYFTLPVLFVMISNHYAMTYSHHYNWLILIAITIAGALIRIYFVSRHKGRASIWPILAAIIILGAVAAAIAPATSTSTSVQTPSVTMAEVEEIMQSRCTTCHAEQPNHVAFTSAPGGVLLDSSASILAQAERIYQQTVVLKAMPLGNLTAITDSERAVIAHWYAAVKTQ